ncbi:hypothetical protein QBC47DRAFT_18251 [Echria macrotheca]|uniref:Uncharacterized protein n=1 Tax=Echria macrotheca TaxID=438768 RepID=A0AAJ0BS03_9PEZI|nr:hypothetical protein QBC47DRAFT_18251 [Echria macrotheca]
MQGRLTRVQEQHKRCSSSAASAAAACQSPAAQGRDRLRRQQPDFNQPNKQSDSHPRPGSSTWERATFGSDDSPQLIDSALFLAFLDSRHQRKLRDWCGSLEHSTGHEGSERGHCKRRRQRMTWLLQTVLTFVRGRRPIDRIFSDTSFAQVSPGYRRRRAFLPNMNRPCATAQRPAIRTRRPLLLSKASQALPSPSRHTKMAIYGSAIWRALHDHGSYGCR